MYTCTHIHVQVHVHVDTTVCLIQKIGFRVDDGSIPVHTHTVSKSTIAIVTKKTRAVELLLLCYYMYVGTIGGRSHRIVVLS